MSLRTLVVWIMLLGICAGAYAADAPHMQDGAVAYYFHGTMRCPTCQKLEQYARQAIENDFKDELASGKLVFRSVNVDLKENGHFIDDYKLFTKSLVLSLVKDGVEVKSKNLQRIWELVGNKEKYSAYVSAEVAAFLKD